MRFPALASSLHRRATRPFNLLLVLLFWGIYCSFALLDPLRPGPVLRLVPLILLLLHLTLAPLPWQWTGDDAPRAPAWRGLLQSIVFSLAWVAVILPLMGQALPRPPEVPRPHAFAAPARRVPPRPLAGGPGFLLLNVLVSVIAGFVLADREARDAREAELAEHARAARARALQSQLDPHVLYNALTGLSELVYEDPLAAEDVINRLGELYRMLSRHGTHDRVPLAEERRLVEAYLAMEQMRLGERLAVAWDWPAWADALVLPPLLLQPLVENAIKHGVSPCPEGGQVRIACRREGDRACLQVENTGQPLKTGTPQGIGLGHLAARLELWTDASARFTLERRGERTVAALRWTPEGGPWASA